jgi:hypothetical protein
LRFPPGGFGIVFANLYDFNLGSRGIAARTNPPYDPPDGAYDGEAADDRSACVAPLAKGIAVSKKRVAILISGRGSNMEALIAAAAQLAM